MPIEIPLDQMSVAEKLQAMEAIWNSLCVRPEDVPSPEWHGRVPAERKRRLESGEATVSDWSDAKKRLQDLGR
jgi:hypothetical protein